MNLPELHKKELFDVAIVGAGLMGSAAAKYLADSGMRCALIGRGEPGPSEDGAVYASHYDEARIVRWLDKDARWGELARKSLEAFPEIELRTGISFHSASGFLRIDCNPSSSAAQQVTEYAAKAAIPHEVLSGHACKDRFPEFCAPDGSLIRHELSPAGHINPRKLISAQHAIFEATGGLRFKAIAERVVRQKNIFEIKLRGQSFPVRAKNVLIAAGASTNFFDILPPSCNGRLPLNIYPETVLLARLPDHYVGSLLKLPSMWIDYIEGYHVPHIYLLPPVLYPDGHSYIKIGADHDHDIGLSSLDDIEGYFKSNGSAGTTKTLARVLHDLLPETQKWKTISKPCVLSYTNSGLPIIEELESRWYACAGGCGQAAKSSDAIGAAVASLII